MPSLTEVANLALALVEQERISRLDSDTSKPAQLCNEFLPQVRRECLALHPWTFARRRASLPALAAAPSFGWTAQYQVPADCIRVWRIEADDPHEPWDREGDVVLCNLAAPLRIRYIADIADSGKWSPLFVPLVAAALAERLAMPLTASAQAAERVTRALDRARAQARAVSGMEGSPNPAYASANVFVEARR
jgi:hypothetical protein